VIRHIVAGPDARHANEYIRYALEKENLHRERRSLYCVRTHQPITTHIELRAAGKHDRTTQNIFHLRSCSTRLDFCNAPRPSQRPLAPRRTHDSANH
jgi:hypothetical protein